MKRKTNLFYVDGPDSKFITFSNYTEALTGNFLSTNTKLFPDKFLCLKINGLNASTKPKFIKYLVAYYENKLAALRDDCITRDENQENYILPLAYLLEAIINGCTSSNGEYTLKSNLPSVVETNEINTKSQEGLIRYIGNITEQDYNGTYTDTICCINANEYYEGKIIFNTSSKISENIKTCTVENFDTLYGWEGEQMFEEYYDSENNKTISPIYDNSTDTYNYDTCINNIEYVEISHNNDSSIYNDSYKTISFNVIIPLFTITNISNTDLVLLEDEVNSSGNKCILLESNINNLKSIRDVPLGMWIYGDETKDTFIELKRDGQLKTYPSWSLLIASQFKPFPYTLKYQKENDSKNSVMTSFNTFAETLSKINDVLDKFNEMNINISSLENKILSLEKQIKEIGTNATIADLDKRFLELNKDVKDQINEFKKQLYGYVDNITWSSKYKNNN